MRVVSIPRALWALAVVTSVATCGFDPHPKSGAVACKPEGAVCCPEGYICVGRGTSTDVEVSPGTCWYKDDLPLRALVLTHDYTPGIPTDPACLVTDWLPPAPGGEQLDGGALDDGSAPASEIDDGGGGPDAGVDAGADSAAVDPDAGADSAAVDPDAEIPLGEDSAGDEWLDAEGPVSPDDAPIIDTGFVVLDAEPEEPSPSPDDASTASVDADFDPTSPALLDGAAEMPTLLDGEAADLTGLEPSTPLDAEPDLCEGECS
jgi:hypothetical protein